MIFGSFHQGKELQRLFFLSCIVRDNQNKWHKKSSTFMKWSFRADDRTRTDDLIPTKDVLYQLSYVSNGSTKVINSSEFKTFVEII